MSDKFIGAQALILNEQPLAFYTHCFSHQLNLCIAKSCDVKPIKNMVGIVSSVSTFVSASAKRVSALQRIINEADASESKKTKLKAFCPTRWVERHDSFIVFKELILHVAKLLEQVEEDPESET